MKSYNTITNALDLAMIDLGNPIDWKAHVDGKENYIKTYLLPYLKNAKTCDITTDCFSVSYTDMSGAPVPHIVNPVIAANPFAIQLPDGSALFQFPGDDDIVLDTNGKNGPNAFGRDLFVINVTDSGLTESEKVKYSGQPVYFDKSPEYCVKEKGLWGDACNVKLITEGKMDY